MSLLVDEHETMKFLSLLPEPEPHEVYLLLAIARSRYVREMLGVKLGDTVLERAVVRSSRDVDWRDKLLRKVKRLCLLLGRSPELYRVRGTPVPAEACGVLILLNPRNVVKAASDLCKRTFDTIYEAAASRNPEEALRKLSKLDVEFASALHRRRSRSVFLTVDIDDPDLFGRVLDLLSPWPVAATTKTARGYHFILRLEGEDRGQFYREGMPGRLKEVGAEVLPDPMEPVAGTLYGGKVVTLVEK